MDFLKILIKPTPYGQKSATKWFTMTYSLSPVIYTCLKFLKNLFLPVATGIKNFPKIGALI